VESALRGGRVDRDRTKVQAVRVVVKRKIIKVLEFTNSQDNVLEPIIIIIIILYIMYIAIIKNKKCKNKKYKNDNISYT
jgi:hypothetical protein